MKKVGTFTVKNTSTLNMAEAQGLYAKMVELGATHFQPESGTSFALFNRFPASE